MLNSTSYPIKSGTRVRMKGSAHLLFDSWHGAATMLSDGIAIKDGHSERTDATCVVAVPWEWAILADQTARPEHADAVSEAKRLEWGWS